MIKIVKRKVLELLTVISLVLVAGISNAQISIGDDLSRISYEAPTEYIIGGIQVEGVENLDKKVIVMLSDIEVGSRIKVPGDEITNAIRKLWDQGLF